MDLVPIYLVFSTLGCLIFSVLLTRRAKEETRSYLNQLKDQLEQGVLDLNQQLEPIIRANSRAMGAISGIADDTKMDKALERRIGKDLLGQNEDIYEMIKMAFPSVAEYVDDHPEAITKLLPRLNTLISDPEARKRLNLDFSSSKSDISRIWKE